MGWKYLPVCKNQFWAHLIPITKIRNGLKIWEIYKWKIWVFRNFWIFRFLQRRFYVIYGAKIKMMHFLIFLSRLGFSWRESNVLKMDFYLLVGIFSSPFSFVYGVNEHISEDRFFYSPCRWHWSVSCWY